jgi:hypothetical protein
MSRLDKGSVNERLPTRIHALPSLPTSGWLPSFPPRLANRPLDILGGKKKGKQPGSCSRQSSGNSIISSDPRVTIDDHLGTRACVTKGQLLIDLVYSTLLDRKKSQNERCIQNLGSIGGSIRAKHKNTLQTISGFSDRRPDRRLDVFSPETEIFYLGLQIRSLVWWIASVPVRLIPRG